MNNTRLGKKDKSQNIQVSIRVRPLIATEEYTKSPSIVEVPNDKEVIVHEFPKDKSTKKFKFDNVFGPSSKQIDVYNAVVNPLLEQVLAGYNCTVFAYGQTGTGKTFTMEGINTDPTLHWRSDSSAGMIPRSLSHLFDELQLLEAQEYTIRVSYLELYNEELFDLLSANDDGSKIRLYEDASKKGAVIIHGLEEITVLNKNEVYKILEKGLERRQIAATLMNAHSSRSHTVFSITVHMKENTIDGEEVLKTGKLNLVDLAGSENVGRSGAIDRRAREAGSINQSLLTLGRVITALVERAPHIPYRESKLTRLLQESLGGRTKTSIIATISPASINHEETLSTLDYARRAKNIMNRPEINQKLSKKEFLKQYTGEIERLRRDLLATRERNGVYLADDNYNEMKALITQQSKAIEGKINHIKALEKSMQDKEQIYNELQLQNVAQKQELDTVVNKLSNATEALKSTHQRLQITTQERDEQKYLVGKHVNTEEALLAQAQSLLNVADTATADSHKLHEKINRKKNVEQKFEMLGEQFKNSIHENFQGIENEICRYGENIKQFSTSIKNNAETILTSETHSCSTDLIENDSAVNNLKENIHELYSSYQNWMKDEIIDAADALQNKQEFFSAVSLKSAENIDELIKNAITKNLQSLKNNLLEKVKETSMQLKEMVNSLCNEELNACDSIRRNIEIIKNDIDEVCKRQELTDKQRSFAKMMDNVSSQFNLLSKSENEHYSIVSGKCNYVRDICDQVNEHAVDNCNSNIKVGTNLQKHVQNHLEGIKSDVVTGTEKNEQLVNKTMIEGQNLVCELKSNIGISCNILKQYKNQVKWSVEEAQQTVDTDKNEALHLLDNANKILNDANENNAMKNEEIELAGVSQNISSKLENLIIELNECCSRNVGQLHTAIGEIHKFFDEEIQRDVPTGTTPAKKEFSYPRQFTATSPHERILRRFREARNLVETLEDDDDTYLNGEMTMKQIANSTAISDTTMASSSSDNICSISSINSELTSKHLSPCNPIDSNTGDFTSALDILGESEKTILVDSLQSEDKENHSYNSFSYKKAKDMQQPKLQKLN